MKPRRRAWVRFRGSTRATAWLALLSLIASIAVGAAHQLPGRAAKAGPFGNLVQFCTLEGIKYYPVPIEGGPTRPLDGKPLSCPICLSLHSASTFVAPATIAVLPPANIVVAYVDFGDAGRLTPSDLLTTRAGAPPKIT